jgi:pimeloyl-[acyl-carrier protein] methyl ester esterase
VIKPVKTKTKLVLTHGWGMNSRVWSMVLPLLQSAFEVQTLDLPGHGRQIYQTFGTELDNWADALLAEAETPAIWMGWSLGGLAALAAASKAPQQVSALVLVASSPRFAQAPDWPHAIAPELLYKFEEALRSNYRQLLEDFLVLQSMGASKLRDDVRRLRACLHEGGEPTPEVLSLGLQFLLHTDLRSVLQKLDCPCLLILGDRDKLVPVQLAEVFRREYPRIDVQIIKGSGHAPFLSHAEEFADMVSAWIKKNRLDVKSMRA